MLKDIDIEKDILNFIVQNPEKKREIVKHCIELGYNERTAYREIDRLEKRNIILYNASDQTFFLSPFITSLKRNLLKQIERGEHQENGYIDNSIMLDSIIEGGGRVQVFSNKNIKISDESRRLLSQLIRNILLDSGFNSIKDLNFEIKIVNKLGYDETLTYIKNLKGSNFLLNSEKTSLLLK